MTVAVALQADQESKNLDFKESFDTESKGEWLELMKDIVAMANSGGGIILVGLFDNGKPSGFDPTQILAVDPADITNKVFSYTGQHFSEFCIQAVSKEGVEIAAIEVGGIAVLIVFNKVGNYQGQNGKQKTAFSLGSVYFRHGAKSEPCTSEDLRQFLHREIESVKQSWLGGIRKVVEAPDHSQILVVPQGTQAGVEPNFRLTDNPNAPEIRLDEAATLGMYPLTYRELTDELGKRYKNFSENNVYHSIRKSLIDKPIYSKIRLLNPKNPRSSKTRFYSYAIIDEFDKHYEK